MVASVPMLGTLFHFFFLFFFSSFAAIRVHRESTGLRPKGCKVVVVGGNWWAGFARIGRGDAWLADPRNLHFGEVEPHLSRIRGHRGTLCGKFLSSRGACFCGVDGRPPPDGGLVARL